MSEQPERRPQAKPVDLAEIVDGMETQSEMAQGYYDCDTGEVVFVSEDIGGFGDFEDEEDMDEASDDEAPDWEREQRDLARAVDEDQEGRFIELPTRFDIHEWDIMRRFAESVEDDAVSARLRGAIHGRGAFRHFKDVLQEAGIEDQWYAYRDRALIEIARDWAEANNIPLKPQDDKGV
jgi:hypothetical protein